MGCWPAPSVRFSSPVRAVAAVASGDALGAGIACKAWRRVHARNAEQRSDAQEQAVVRPSRGRAVAARARSDPDAGFLGAVVSYGVVYGANRRRRNVLERMARQNACFMCGFAQERPRQSCAECGSTPVYVVRARVPDHRDATLARAETALRGVLFLAAGLFVLAALVGETVRAVVFVAPLFGPVLLGMLTVRHLRMHRAWDRATLTPASPASPACAR